MHKFGKRALTLILGAAWLGACSPQAASTQQQDVRAEAAMPERHPVSGLEVVPLTIESGEEEHVFAVEVARTFDQQRRGLMERPPLGDNEGMIFPYNPPGVQSFWMKNTPSSLDIIYVGPDERIINIYENTEPLSEESLPSAGPASLVLEIRGGRSAELGIEPGDRVTW
ncbi:DUF192 domain-containing protein [Altererythrobacter aurantiacus]|uniref:DUF192 domain-containing protein n=1 Tax=Parapontixanthobacter aurantiacus TaxID=1463599 RepID=A0A844ZJ01_9SPHN|nr:DUF192 domain-containing protein [Parapontixanthobacter aurantiacus]MXO86970.1 DUF192 domain-containing protein [Parapontixanthobacter aurantiacus]